MDGKGGDELFILGISEGFKYVFWGDPDPDLGVEPGGWIANGIAAQMAQLQNLLLEQWDPLF
jgi:hypothetical protein